jgi:hypothetical protein
MDELSLRDLLLRKYQVRIEEQMARYAIRRLQIGKVFPVFGGNARTGVAVHAIIDPSRLSLEPPSLSSHP